MRNIQKETADKYQEFFNFMSQEHGLILTIDQMDEIVFEAQRLIKKLTIPIVSICTCGTEEYAEKEPRDDGMTYCGKCGFKY